MLCALNVQHAGDHRVMNGGLVPQMIQQQAAGRMPMGQHEVMLVPNGINMQQGDYGVHFAQQR